MTTLPSPFRVLFVCKKRSTYWGVEESYANEISSGLGNSVRFLVDMLTNLGVAAKSIEVQDNNAIAAQIAAFRPSHVIIEALWVVPAKFDVLRKLYPRVQWIVRVHSEIPFLSSEGVATEWIAGYLARGVEVMSNSSEAHDNLRQVAIDYGRPDALVTYGPNFYPLSTAPVPPFTAATGEVHVGCFGAIRPLKNQLLQAIAALAFANQAGLRLFFHVNASRLEGVAGPILRNLQALFAGSVGVPHVLVQEPWMPHDQFLKVLGGMDVSMQVSLSETFNLVAADSVAVGVPTVVSPEIAWLGSYTQANPTDARAVTVALLNAWLCPRASRDKMQRGDLQAWSSHAEAIWSRRFT